MSVTIPTDAFGRIIGGSVTTTQSGNIDTSNFLKKTDIINKDNLPQTINSVALNSQGIYLKNINSNNHYLKEFSDSTGVYAKLDGEEGVILSSNNTNIFLQAKGDILSIKDKRLRDVSEIRASYIIMSGVSSGNSGVWDKEGMAIGDNRRYYLRNASDKEIFVRYNLADLPNRVELSGDDRMRFSLTKGRNGTTTVTNNERSYGANAQYIELFHDHLDVNKNKIRNLEDPVLPKDAVTKSYVDSKLGPAFIKTAYQNILTTLQPTFWISSKFPYGFEDDQNRVTDLSGTGLTATNVPKTFLFPANGRVVSTATYDTRFTFVIKAKKITPGASARAFTSSAGNRLFGWWAERQRCLWMEGNIIGVSNHAVGADARVHTYMLVANNDLKAFYENKDTIVSSTAGDPSWAGSVVVGRSTTHPVESSIFQIYEAIAFNKVLTETELFDLHDKVLIL